ncbi:G-protein coupled receptor 151-like [Ambystoma mexicanum]|uniref:G-protein coupled receptor 151-like n=1 Tax=Ambystoma mexicanum TaxID=8296 RepID=UPI0037E8B1C3
MGEQHFRAMNSSQAIFFAGGAQSPSEAPVELTVVLPLLLATICLVGLGGNLLVVAILAHDFRRGKGSAVNALVVHLCATDLLLVCFCIPFRVVTYARHSWVLGAFVCRTTDWFLHSCWVAKSFTLAAIGQARYRHVVTPPKLLSLDTRQLVGVLLFIWSLAIVMPLPHLLFTRIQESQGATFCVFQVPPNALNFMDVFSKLYPLLAYVLPMCFSFCCYMRAMRHRKERRPRAPSPRHLSRKLTSMLMSVSLAFEAMWLPEWVVWVWARHSAFEGQKPPAAFTVLAQVVMFLNCTLNPGVFMAVSDEFRQGFRDIWLMVKCQACLKVLRPGSGLNGGEVATSTVQSLQDLHSAAKAEPTEVDRLKEDVILPDVEHFWQDRRNTTAGEENDPTPWEHQDRP